MATLAVAIVNEVSMNPEGMYLRYQVWVPDQSVDQVPFGPIVPGTLINAILGDLTSAVKVFVTARFGLTFGPSDTVEIFYPADRVA